MQDNVCFKENRRRRWIGAYKGCRNSKAALDTFATLFSKKNDMRLQLLESELLSIAQWGMMISQYFHKVKTLCRESTELDPSDSIGETRMKRIIIHGLIPEYRGFVVDIQGWQNQPLVVEFENFLTGQEVLTKQMEGISLKGEEKALYTCKNKGNSRQHTAGWSKKNNEKVKYHQRKESTCLWRASKYHG